LAPQTLDVRFQSDRGSRLDGYHVIVRVLPPGTVSRRARALICEVLLKAGVDEEGRCEAENVVAELAANAEMHAHHPFELRIVTIGGEPVWCELVDGDRNLDCILAILTDLRSRGDEPKLSMSAECGRGLLLVHLLSKGRCEAYQTSTFTTGAPGKAVAFALPFAGRTI
jgi:hypothetical protein